MTVKNEASCARSVQLFCKERQSERGNTERERERESERERERERE